MSDLRIDYDLLQDSAESLGLLSSELSALGSHDEDRHLWGSSLIADRMVDVVDNWSFHRGKLSEAVEATASMVTAALDGFRSTDGELAKVFDVDGGRR